VIDMGDDGEVSNQFHGHASCVHCDARRAGSVSPGWRYEPGIIAWNTGLPDVTASSPPLPGREEGPKRALLVLLASRHRQADETVLVPVPNQQQHRIARLCILGGIAERSRITYLFLVDHQNHVPRLQTRPGGR
jgi:hypothetical protein